MDVKEKLIEAAKEYIYASVKFEAWDNYEDMSDEEKWKHAFSFVAHNTEFESVNIKKFISQHLPDHVNKTIKVLEKEAGDKIDKNKLKLIKKSFEN